MDETRVSSAKISLSNSLTNPLSFFRFTIQNPNALYKQLFTFQTKIITTYI